MKIHEYQARDLLAQYGIPVPDGQMVSSVEQAAHAFKTVTAGMTSPLAVVKAQVHAGGRGKAGFVKLVKAPQDAEAAVRFMLTNRMVSPQTPPEGLDVTKVLIAAGVDIADRAGGGKEEFYLAVTTDRRTRRNILIASREGGVDIEHVAATKPDAIIKEPIHPLVGLQAFQGRDIAARLGFTGRGLSQAADIMQRLSRLFVEKDCTLAEINPLIITAGSPGGEIGRAHV